MSSLPSLLNLHKDDAVLQAKARIGLYGTIQTHLKRDSWKETQLLIAQVLEYRVVFTLKVG